MMNEFPTGRRLALDYGASRIGIAVSDASGILATPLTVTSIDQIENELTRIYKEEEFKIIYIGLPKHLSGAEGESARAARALAANLARLFKVPISLVDERLTTRSAAADSDAVKKYGIDAVAAKEILELALAGEKNSKKIFGDVLKI
jgi:putative Holliday junction resolvase